MVDGSATCGQPNAAIAFPLARPRILAREFTGAEQTPGISEGDLKNFGLSMKPREAFRYQSKSHDVLDGIIFWFTQEDKTDPELLLMIEAVSNQKANSWRYALARLSCWPMQIDHKGTRVADLPNLLNKTGKSDPFHIWRPATRDRMYVNLNPFISRT